MTAVADRIARLDRAGLGAALDQRAAASVPRSSIRDVRGTGLLQKAMLDASYGAPTV